MKLSAIEVDSAIIEQGEWVDHPYIPDVKVKVRGVGNADFRRLSTKLTRQFSAAQREAGIDPNEQDRITATLLTETILTDWRGLEEEDGSPMPYSKERAAAILGNPNLRVFRDGVDQAAVIVSTRAKAAREAASPN